MSYLEAASGTRFGSANLAWDSHIQRLVHAAANVSASASASAVGVMPDHSVSQVGVNPAFSPHPGGQLL